MPEPEQAAYGVLITTSCRRRFDRKSEAECKTALDLDIGFGHDLA